MMTSIKKLVVLLGPTGVGKTDLSISLAQHFNTDILSCDSRQFYKEMTIGTAVPSLEQLSAVKHHFIQNISITDNYNCGEYETDALKLISELFHRNNYLFIVGGSGLYIDAVCDGFDDMPRGDEQLRERLKSTDIETLWHQLEELDPTYCKEVDRNNRQRISRALEVCILSGKKYSDLRQGKVSNRPFKVIKIGININRALLYERINKRVDIMVEQGLIEEAKGLYQQRDLNALQTVGYRELFDYFSKKITKEEAIELIKRNSRRYAKRQMTWFNRDEHTKWFAPNEKEQIIEYISR